MFRLLGITSIAVGNLALKATHFATDQEELAELLLRLF